MTWGDHFRAVRLEYNRRVNNLYYLMFAVIGYLFLGIVLHVPAALAAGLMCSNFVFLVIAATWQYLTKPSVASLRVTDESITTSINRPAHETSCLWSDVHRVTRNKNSVSFVYNNGVEQSCAKIRAQDLPPGVTIDHVYAVFLQQWKTAQATRHELGRCHLPTPPRLSKSDS